MAEDPNKSTAIRDALASVLLDVLEKGASVADEEGNLVRATPAASYLTAAKDYLKQFPPSDLPTARSVSNELARFVNPTGKGLPFAASLETKGH